MSGKLLNSSSALAVDCTKLVDAVTRPQLKLNEIWRFLKKKSTVSQAPCTDAASCLTKTLLKSRIIVELIIFNGPYIHLKCCSDAVLLHFMNFLSLRLLVNPLRDLMT